MDNVVKSSYSVTDLNYIRETIEGMNKFNQIEILKIMKNNNVMLNENNYGIHINMTELEEKIIIELINYITYFNTQEQTLNNLEKQQEDYKNNFFSKEFKDKININ